MMINAIDAARDKGLSALPRDERLTLSLLLATQGAMNVQLRSQEDEAIEGEDFWTQAEEANAIDPIG